MSIGFPGLNYEPLLSGWKGTSVFLSPQEVIDKVSLTSGLD